MRAVSGGLEVGRQLLGTYHRANVTLVITNVTVQTKH